MSMEIGTIVTVSVATAIIASGNHAGITEAWIFGIIALVLAATIPLVSRVPEHRGAW